MAKLALLRRQVTALKSSVLKWQKVVFEEGIDLGSDNCDCCQEFASQDFCSYSCSCPIVIETGDACCDSTPYGKWSDYMDDSEEQGLVKQDEWKVFDKKSRKLAKDELEFLRRLYRNYSRRLNRLKNKKEK